MSQEIFIRAEMCDAGQRLDSFLALRLPAYTRAQLSKFIKNALVHIDDSAVKPSFKLRGHEKVRLIVPKIQSSMLVAQALPLDIIFCDEHIAVINKACGMVVHPGAGVPDNTLVNALLYCFPNMAVGGQERPGIVHRLDKDTSGIMVVALSHQAHVVLAHAFKNREIEKIYRVFCYGEPESEHFELKTGHIRHPKNRLRFFTGIPAPLSKQSHVRLAHTGFSIKFSNFGICELEARLHTGRTHQIRAHLADINHPLVGDALYSGKRSLTAAAPSLLLEAVAKLLGQALHAETIRFMHPVTKEYLNFSAPLPAHLEAISRALRNFKP